MIHCERSEGIVMGSEKIIYRSGTLFLEAMNGEIQLNFKLANSHN